LKTKLERLLNKKIEWLPDAIKVLEVQVEGLPLGWEHQQLGGGGERHDEPAQEVQDQVQGKENTSWIRVTRWLEKIAQFFEK
jgi:hypothetical protein